MGKSKQHIGDVIKSLRQGVFEFMNILEDSSTPTNADKYYQQFVLFIKNESVSRHISSLRDKYGISIGKINGRIAQIRDAMANFDEATQLVSQFKSKNNLTDSSEELMSYKKDIRYEPARASFNKLWSNLETEINSRVPLKVLHDTLMKFDKPISWENTLCWYFISGKIIPPSIRCWVYCDVGSGRVIVEISADATDDDLKKAFSRVSIFQSRLMGHAIKGKRHQKKFKEKLAVLSSDKTLSSIRKSNKKVYDIATQRRVSKRQRLEDRKMDLNPELANMSKSKRQKEDNRRRQALHRAKTIN